MQNESLSLDMVASNEKVVCAQTLFLRLRVYLHRIQSLITPLPYIPSNRTRIDADFVQKTQYNLPLNRIAKKPFSKSSYLSPNTVRKPLDSKDWKRPRRALRTLFGCRICKIPFCNKSERWLPHIERLNSKD